MTPQEIADGLIRSARNLHVLSDDAGERLKEAALARDAYEQARSVAYLKATGTVAEREAQAEIECAKERREKLTTEAIAKGYMLRINATRDGIDALQSAGSVLKTEMNLER